MQKDIRFESRILIASTMDNESAASTFEHSTANKSCEPVCLHTAQESLVHELRNTYPKTWAIVSSSDSSRLNIGAVRSRLRYLKLGDAALGSDDMALQALITYLRGNANGLEVRESLIPGAGRGLFVTRPFFEGELVCVYSGTPVPLTSLLRGEVNTDYVMGGFGVYSIDASDHLEVLARYVNDNLEQECRNAKFVKLKQERRALVLATRNLAPGEEIYAAYGEGYWRTRSTEEQKDACSISLPCG